MTLDKFFFYFEGLPYQNRFTNKAVCCGMIAPKHYNILSVRPISLQPANFSLQKIQNLYLCFSKVYQILLNSHVEVLINFLTSIQSDEKVRMSNTIEPMKFKFKRQAANSTNTSNSDTKSQQQTINSFFKVQYILIKM